MTKVLLVVDDQADLLTAYTRYFRRYFDTIYAASNPTEAEPYLMLTKDQAPTHLLCDYWMGENHPLGTTVIPLFRRKCPSIQCAVLMSGSAIQELTACDGIDAIFEKPTDMAKVRAMFDRQPV